MLLRSILWVMLRIFVRCTFFFEKCVKKYSSYVWVQRYYIWIWVVNSEASSANWVGKRSVHTPQILSPPISYADIGTWRWGERKHFYTAETEMWSLTLTYEMWLVQDVYKSVRLILQFYPSAPWRTINIGQDRFPRVMNEVRAHTVRNISELNVSTQIHTDVGGSSRDYPIL